VGDQETPLVDGQGGVTAGGNSKTVLRTPYLFMKPHRRDRHQAPYSFVGRWLGGGTKLNVCGFWKSESMTFAAECWHAGMLQQEVFRAMALAWE